MRPHPSPPPSLGTGRLLTPHMSEKNLKLLQNVTGYFGSKPNLQRITTDQLFKADLRTIANALRVMYRLPKEQP